MKSLVVCSLLLASGVAIADGAYSRNCQVGEVTSFKGQVELQRKDQKMTPTIGMKICQGDKFHTIGGSVAELRLRDGTKLTVGKDTDFAIKEFHIYRKKPNVALFDLFQGAFRSLTGSLTQRQHRFEVTTKVATIGVRGTDFWGGFGVSPDGALDVIMLDGHGVYVKNASGQVELDKPGLGTTVSATGVPAEPKMWPEEKVKKAVATITPE